MGKNIIIMVGLVALISGCSAFGAPDCSDEAVKQLVSEISNEEMKNQLILQAFVTQLGVSPELYGNPSYADLKNKADDENAQALVKFVDEQLATAAFTITGIRTNGKNDEIKKSECGANLNFANGNSLPITYTAHYTEDDQVYVEVSGLQ